MKDDLADENERLAVIGIAVKAPPGMDDDAFWEKLLVERFEKFKINHPIILEVFQESAAKMNDLMSIRKKNEEQEEWDIDVQLSPELSEPLPFTI
jgi:hypothetical protein